VNELISLSGDDDATQWAPRRMYLREPGTPLTLFNESCQRGCWFKLSPSTSSAWRSSRWTMRGDQISTCFGILAAKHPASVFHLRSAYLQNRDFTQLPC
jgi:hypothetical protein